MDYGRTRSLYQEIGQIKKFEETADFNRYKKELRWYEDVKSKRTGEYYQAEDLIKRDMVAKTWNPPHVDDKGQLLKYPLKYVDGIFRVRTADMSEWLISTQTWWGIDVYGNALNISMNYKERYDDIRPVYTSKAKNPKERDTEMILEITSIGHRMKYTLPFTSENCDALYAMRNGSCSISLPSFCGGLMICQKQHCPLVRISCWRCCSLSKIQKGMSLDIVLSSGPDCCDCTTFCKSLKVTNSNS